MGGGGGCDHTLLFYPSSKTEFDSCIRLNQSLGRPKRKEPNPTTLEAATLLCKLVPPTVYTLVASPVLSFTLSLSATCMSPLPQRSRTYAGSSHTRSQAHHECFRCLLQASSALATCRLLRCSCYSTRKQCNMLRHNEVSRPLPIL